MNNQMKLHYVRKNNEWWVFRSIDHHKKYIDALKKEVDSHLYQPRPLIVTECGIM